MFSPTFRITPATAKAVMEIEACRQIVTALPIDIAVLKSLRETARIAAVHYSTQIEGNRLTERQVRDVLAGAHFPGRERDEVEVRNYYKALEWMEGRVQGAAGITEGDIKRLHGLSFVGRNRGSPYRDGQNVIRDSGSGRIVYLPPEAKDVAELMAALARWINRQSALTEWPAPVVAALAHYQLATIHPWFDGNGRTARLLATLILQQASYGLKGIYSLDAYYARDLAAYYRALTVGPSHNYYEGRAEADLSGFVEYFCTGMAEAFTAVRAAATAAAARDAPDLSGLLRSLDPRRRRLLELFSAQASATAAEIARHLGLGQRTVVALCRDWIASGFLEFADQSRKNRAYRIGAAYAALIARPWP
jgi:Fic family protein